MGNPNFIRGERWMPLSLEFKNEPGDTLRVLSSHFASYFANVQSWRHAFDVKEACGELRFTVDPDKGQATTHER
jgi:hypothetical protein